jgi:hypothetical protein
LRHIRTLTLAGNLGRGGDRIAFDSRWHEQDLMRAWFQEGVRQITAARGLLSARTTDRSAGTQ